MFDILSTAELTISASIVAGFLSLVVAETARSRVTVLVGLGAWFVLVLALGATGALSPAGLGAPALGLAVVLPIAALVWAYFALPWIPERSATCLREADLNVLSKLGNQGLEWRLEPEAFTGREVCREDDLLDILVGCPVDIQVARQPST